MKAYRVTVYAAGWYKYVNTLEEACETAGPCFFVGPDDGPEPGKPWEGYESGAAYCSSAAPAPVLARIELVELPN